MMVETSVDQNATIMQLLTKGQKETLSCLFAQLQILFEQAQCLGQLPA